MSGGRRPKGRITASREVYQSLRDSITRGTFGPGHRLSEVELAESFGVSRTPVREALRLLSADGMIDYRPRSIAVVAEWTDEEVLHLSRLRSHLEGYAASVAGDRAMPDDVNKLRELNARIAELASIGERSPQIVDELVHTNIEFHEHIVTMAQSRILLTQFRRMLHYPLHQRVMSIYGTEGLQTSIQQHAIIVNALEQHDGDWAGALMVAHIMSSRSYAVTKDGESATDRAQ